jgi:hypothetical protein
MSASNPLTWTYNFTGSAGVLGGQTGDNFQIAQPPSQGGAALYTDNFFKNNVAGNNLFEVILTYRTVANGGTQMTVESATTKITSTQPSFILTFADPTNQYKYGVNDSLTGTYGVANSMFNATTLPLPDQATLSTYFKVSTATPGSVQYKDDLLLSGPITILYPLGGSIPEPSALVMGSMAIVIGAAGYCVSRRRRSPSRAA